MFDFDKIIFPTWEQIVNIQNKHQGTILRLFKIGPFGSGYLHCFTKHREYDVALKFTLFPPDEKVYPPIVLYLIEITERDYEWFQGLIISRCKEVFNVNYDYSSEWGRYYD